MLICRMLAMSLPNLSLQNDFASKTRSRNRSRKLIARSIATSSSALTARRLLLTRMLIPERYLRFPFAFSQNPFSYFHTPTHSCLHSFALVKTSTSVLSIRCALFGENHRGWGVSAVSPARSARAGNNVGARAVSKVKRGPPGIAGCDRRQEACGRSCERYTGGSVFSSQSMEIR